MKKFLNIIFGRAVVVAISIIFQFLWLFSILHRLSNYYVQLSMIASIIGIFLELLSIVIILHISWCGLLLSLHFRSLVYFCMHL